MKPIRTPDCNVTLTLPGGTEDNDLPAQRAMLYDTSIGETQSDARLGFVTRWMPTEDEAKRIEAGAAVELTITGGAHPPVMLTVTDAVLPGADLVARIRVEKALAKLYADLKARAGAGIEATENAWKERYGDLHDAWDADELHAAVLPDAATFADLWANALDATKEDAERAQAAQEIIAPDPRHRARRNGQG